MTVAELVLKLQAMPKNAVVVYSCFSECVELDGDWPSLTPMIERHGTYMEFQDKTWDYKKDGHPKIQMVCHFPGN